MAKAVPPADTFWNRPVQELAAQLNSSAAGLASAEAQARLAQVGANVLAIKRKTTALGLFLRQFKSPIVLILLLATFLSALLQASPSASSIAGRSSATRLDDLIQMSKSSNRWTIAGRPSPSRMAPAGSAHQLERGHRPGRG